MVLFGAKASLVAQGNKSKGTRLDSFVLGSTPVHHFWLLSQYAAAGE